MPRGPRKWPEPCYSDFWSVTLGTFQSAEAYRHALRKPNYVVDDWAKDILFKIDLAPAEVVVDLVAASVEDLGFSARTTYSEVCARARDIDLALCPAEVGPALCLAYKPSRVHIAMEPIAERFGEEVIFSILSNGTTQSLIGTSGDAGRFCRLADEFVFLAH